jgi:UDP-glucose 4-epimerase
VYGPRQSNNEYSGVVSIFINTALANQPLVIHGSGDQIRDFISVHDVVNANIKSGIMKLPRFSVFNVASSSKTTIHQLAEIIQKETGLTKKQIYSKSRKGDIIFSQAKTDAIQKHLEWTPEVKLRDGIKETIQWYKKE